MTDQHPTVPTWTPEPPPASRRRLGPGLLAGLIAVLLLFGGVGLYAARQVAGTAQGASSPEAAAAGLLTALGSQDLDRAAGYLDAEEALLLDTYRDRVTALLAGRMTGPTGQPLSGLQLTARDIRFQRVAGLGGADVAVVELAGGTVGGSAANGAKLELPAAELNRRLADQSKGAVKALRAVAVRTDDRWRVSLLATAAEQARLAAGAGEPDWDQLAGAGQPAAPGAASPEAAVRELADAAGRGQQAALERLSPAERRVLAAYGPLLDRHGGKPAAGRRPRRGPPDPHRAGRRRRDQGPCDRRPAGRRQAQQVAPLDRAAPPRARHPTSSPSSGTGRGIHPWCSPSPTGCCTEQNGSARDRDPAGRRRPRLPRPPPPRPGAPGGVRRGGLVPGGRQRQRRPGHRRGPASPTWWSPTSRSPPTAASA